MRAVSPPRLSPAAGLTVCSATRCHSPSLRLEAARTHGIIRRGRSTTAPSGPSTTRAASATRTEAPTPAGRAAGRWGAPGASHAMLIAAAPAVSAREPPRHDGRGTASCVSSSDGPLAGCAPRSYDADNEGARPDKKGGCRDAEVRVPKLRESNACAEQRQNRHNVVGRRPARRTGEESKLLGRVVAGGLRHHDAHQYRCQQRKAEPDGHASVQRR